MSIEVPSPKHLNAPKLIYSSTSSLLNYSCDSSNYSPDFECVSPSSTAASPSDSSSCPSSPKNGTITSTRSDSKLCGVCGDKALGYNFNAITCESCKAFFRRNALKRKEFKCPFNDNCKIDVVTRRFCQKCRLQKCFQLGMKKEWIMTEEERKIKKQKIDENRAKRNGDYCAPGNTACANSRSQSIQEITKSATSTLLIETSASRCVNYANGFKNEFANGNNPENDSYIGHEFRLDFNDQICHEIEITEELMFGSNDSPEKLDFINEPEAVSLPKNKLSTCELQISNASALNEQADGSSETIEPLPSSSTISTTKLLNGMHYDRHYLVKRTLSEKLLRNFNDIELTRINELLLSNQHMTLPLTPCIDTSSFDPSLINVINLTDIAIRRLIKMSKKIVSFKQLCQEDQIALLKGGCTEVMILRSVMNYNPEKDCWQMPHKFCIPVNVMKEASVNLYEAHKQFIRSFGQWKSNEVIMLILGAITLFSPTRANIVQRDYIAHNQKIYFSLLMRYLELALPQDEAQENYNLLLEKLEELHVLNEHHVKVYLDVNPKEVEPLLIEIFNLKD